MLMLSLVYSSMAYYRFKKVYSGDGELPILNINYTFTSGNENLLKNITYNGQSSENIAINVNTFGNNLTGLVRVKIFPSWQNTLSNSVYNSENEIVYACFVKYNTNVWQDIDGWLYLNNPMQKDSEVELFSEVVFNDLSDNYRGKKLDIYIIYEIYQTNNLPANWGN